ncbi:MAG: SUMF1/EgtB/PvdO family nonheme iron enzyme [bacterium]|nr:SUMF1/EgtB/PvdO family nonheme iron enzyme [bacterium]
MKFFLVPVFILFVSAAFGQDSLLINFGNKYVSTPVWIEAKGFDRPKKVEIPKSYFYSPINFANYESLGFTFHSYIDNLQEEPARFYYDTLPDFERIQLGKEQEIMDSLLYPFYLSALELTNREYREFVDWTRDSIAREILVVNTPSVKEKRKMLCNCTESEADKAKSGQDFNRDSCRLDWTYDFSYMDPQWVECLSDMYYPQPERFYGRRAFDISQLNYRYDNGQVVTIYPDTLGFVKKLDFGDPLTNMYFWHPAYDRYPVVNLTFEQMMAFCHWKTKEVNKTLKEGRIEVSLPTILHYELAAKYVTFMSDEQEIVNVPNDFFITGERNWEEQHYYLSKVGRPLHLPKDHQSSAPLMEEVYHRWRHERYNDFFRFLTGNVSEVVLDTISPASLQYYNVESEHLSGGHFTMGENYTERVESMDVPSLNTVFYKQILLNGESNCYTGFRLLYRWYPE